MAEKKKIVVAPDEEVEQYSGEEFEEYMKSGARPARFAGEAPPAEKKEEDEGPFAGIRRRNKALREIK